MKSNKLLVLLALLLAAALTLAGCSSGKNAMYDSYSAAEAPMEAPAPAAEEFKSEVATDQDTSGNGSVSLTEGQATGEDYGLKIIYNAYLNIEALDYDQSISAVAAAVKAAGGYVQSSETYGGYTRDDRYYNRSANIVYRIPSDAYREFIDGSSDFGNVTNCSEYTDDITSSYLDVAARLASLEAQEARLLELLEKADNVSDLLTIESELSNVRYQIESYSSQKKTFDSLVSFSTVTVNIQEVAEITPVAEKTFGERLVSAVEGSAKSVVAFLKEALVFLIYALPYILIIAVVIAVVRLLTRKSRERRREARAAKKAVRAARAAERSAPKNEESKE